MAHDMVYCCPKYNGCSKLLKRCTFPQDHKLVNIISEKKDYKLNGIMLRHGRTAATSDSYWRQVSPEVQHRSALGEMNIVALKLLGLLTKCDSIRDKMP